MRGFSDEQRERIREGLIDAGHELFSRYGLGKTTIDELTDPVGIATSTFYRFFDSKEELYVEILEREGEEITARLSAELESADDPEAAMKRFLRLITEEIETNPFIRTIVTEDELGRLATEYDGGHEEGRERALAYLRPLVREWAEGGALRDADPEVIASTLRTVTFVTLHREEIGADLYPATRDLLIDLVAEGLVTDGE